MDSAHARRRSLHLATAALTAAFAALWLAGPARADGEPAPAAPGTDVVLSLTGGTGEAKAEQLAGQVAGQVVDSIPQIGAYLVDLPSETAPAQEQAADALDDQAAVRDAEPTEGFGLLEEWAPFATNDPLFGSQWHLATIGAEQGWLVTTGDPSVVIAVIDTGVDYTHPDLSGKVTLGIDAANGDSDPMDTHGHGTHVAGIAAAITGNGTGVAGVCPGCQILAIKVFPDGSGWASDWDVAEGIVWAADNGADVINLSLGGPGGSTLMQNAVNYAWSRGVVVVAAAGNSGSTTPSYPAAFTNAVAVVATTSSDTKASFSNYGSWVDVSAPGQSILSTVMGAGYQSWSGTSMATPVVAGAAGLVFASLGASASASAVRAALEGHAVDLGAAGRDDTFGWGRVDAAAAVSGSEPPPPPPPAVTTSSLPAAMLGTAYSQTLAASSGTQPYTWSLASGTLPTGLTLNASSGLISGTPTQSGSFALTVRVTDAVTLSATKALTLTVNAPPAVDLSGYWQSLTARTRRGVTTISAKLKVTATGANVQTPFVVAVSILDGQGIAVRSVQVSLRSVTTRRGATVSFSFAGAYRGLTLRAAIDSGGQIAEANEANNTADRTIP